MFLPELPPSHSSFKRNKNAHKYSHENMIIQNYQKNYINKYSLLFVEKEELSAKNKNLDAVIEQQKQIISKLMSNNKIYGNDVATQTYDVIGVDIQIQTDTNTIDAASQTGREKYINEIILFSYQFKSTLQITLFCQILQRCTLTN